MIGEIADCVAVFHADQDAVHFVIFQKSVCVIRRNLQSTLERILLAYLAVLHLRNAKLTSAALPGSLLDLRRCRAFDV
jgi:hypothetical protein